MFALKIFFRLVSDSAWTGREPPVQDWFDSEGRIRMVPCKLVGFDALFL